MADDYHRVFVKCNDEEKPVQVSRTDLTSALQETWIKDVEHGWKSIRADMPKMIHDVIEAYEEKKERDRQKVIAEMAAKHDTGTIREQVTDMASGRYGIPMTILGVGLFVIGLALIMNLPMFRNIFG